MTEQVQGRQMTIEPRKATGFKGINWREYRSLIGLFVLMVILAVLTEGTFLSPRNLSNLARQVAINGILAVGMTYVIILRGIDLSVGSVVALAGIVAGFLQVHAGLSAWAGMGQYGGAILTVLAAVGVGVACGVFNGWWITRYRIAPFIITLGMMVIARGLALIFSNGTAISPLGDALGSFGQGYVPQLASTALVGGLGGFFVVRRVLAGRFRSGADVAFLLSTIVLTGIAVYSFLGYRGMPVPVLVFAVLGLGGIVILQRTRLGRFVMAIGGNPDAAWLAGVPSQKIIFGVYVAMGALAGLSGAILAARLNGALPTAGELFELDAIAAVVIGGTSLAGGIGKVQGSIIGAFFIGAMNNGMSLLTIPEFYQKVIKGVIIILAVWFDTRQQGKAKK